jgi:hypothetical protein
MEVDDMRGARVRINFDVTFPSLPCALLSVGAVDESGAEHEDDDVMSHVLKRRLDPAGNALSAAESDALGGALTSQAELLKAAKAAAGSADGAPPADAAGGDGGDATPECPSCYGAGAPGQCCLTCADVREAYRRKGWTFNAATVTQCAQGVDLSAMRRDEGCQVFGFVEVPKVSGNLHFAPSRAVQSAWAGAGGGGFSLGGGGVLTIGGGGDDGGVLAAAWAAFNASHRVRSLSFGAPLPGVANPLDGVAWATARGEFGAQQYYAKVVPTTLVPLAGPATASFQFAVTQHLRRMRPGEDRGVPGVWLFYEFSAIHVRREERRKSWGHFVTQLCAVVGGVFTSLALVDAALHAFIQKRGKAVSVLQ